jgi:ferredoxin
MEWDKKAIEQHERMAIPPNAEDSYATFFGREKTQEMKNLLEGKEPIPKMVEELFFDPTGMLYNIQVCPVKYGSQSKEVADGILDIFKGVKEIFEKEDLEQIIADSSRIPLCESSRFNVVIAGCSNCCEPPFFSDLGIIGQHIPEITEAECLQCGKCVSVCYEDAITLNADGPVINRNRCINCEFCAKSCSNEKIVIGKRGYKVTAAGRAYRHPAIAKTIKGFTDKEGVITTTGKIVNLLRKGKEGDTLKGLIEKHGIETLQ